MCSLCRKHSYKLIWIWLLTVIKHLKTIKQWILIFFSYIFHDISETRTLLILQILRRQAEQESSNEPTCDDNVLFHKLCGLKKEDQKKVPVN